MPKTTQKTKVTIGVLTYNHEKYIEECLNSVVSQAGDFDLRIIIVNDRSKDTTDKVVKDFIAKHPSLNIEYVTNKTNLGAQKSIYKTLGLIKATKPEYWSYIEGDDKYLSADRTQQHITLLHSDKTAIMSYNRLLLIDQKSKTIAEHEPKQLDRVLTTNQLAAYNHIGSFCATFYSGKCFDFFDPKEFDGLIVYDWFFNIWMSRFGSVKLLPEYLSGYRQHPASVWSSRSQTEQYWELIWSIDSYNKKLDFVYDKAFQSYKRNIINQLSAISSPMRVDVVVISENFMSSEDLFTSGAPKYILRHNDNAVALAPAKKDMAASAQTYKYDNADIANKVIGYNGDYSIMAKAIYATSIDDAFYRALPISDNFNTLLVFEICKDDEKTIQTADITKKLKAIFNSVNFVKVIVHSESIKTDIISRKLCDSSRMVVIPSTVSEKIYGKGNIYGPAQLTSYYLQINNLLKQCIAGTLRPQPLHPLKKLKMRYHTLKPAIIRRIRTKVRGNKITFFMARVIMKLLRLIYRSKE